MRLRTPRAERARACAGSAAHRGRETRTGRGAHRAPPSRFPESRASWTRVGGPRSANHSGRPDGSRCARASSREIETADSAVRAAASTPPRADRCRAGRRRRSRRTTTSRIRPARRRETSGARRLHLAPSGTRSPTDHWTGTRKWRSSCGRGSRPVAPAAPASRRRCRRTARHSCGPRSGSNTPRPHRASHPHTETGADRRHRPCARGRETRRRAARERPRAPGRGRVQRARAEPNGNLPHTEVAEGSTRLQRGRGARSAHRRGLPLGVTRWI